MQNLSQRLEALGVAIPEIMFPKSGTDLQKWAVIACDQFTQDRSYWTEVEHFVGDAPSTLNLIFPEVYLGDSGSEDRIRNIHQTMRSYLKDAIFDPPQQCLVYIERSTPYNLCRRGLVLAIDLEQYDWKADTRFLIRSTEGTVEERLPPRIAIRQNAALELSHVILLIDDEEDFLLPGLGKWVKTAAPMYRTLITGGTITGWALKREKDWAYLAKCLESLVQKSLVRYGDDEPPFLFAVGDGNHSLASAKAVWEDYKALHSGEPNIMKHPKRWALVEVENFYDPSISFEPIHRLLFGSSIEEVLNVLAGLPDFTSRPVADSVALFTLVEDREVSFTRLGLMTSSQFILVEYDAQDFATDSLQPLLDAFIKKNVQYTIDYIHGKSALLEGTQNAEKPGVGIMLPPVKKGSFFKTVANRGPLPRKSFSMGEAEEKRFYLECRKLF